VLAVSEDEDAEDIARSSYAIDPEVFLRVNFDRFDVHIRDDIICKAVKTRYNQTTAVVFQAMMKMNIRSNEEFPSIKDEQSVMLHVNSLRQFLPDGISLKRAFERNSLKEEVGSDPAQSVLLGEVISILLGAGDTSRVGLSRRLVSPSTKTTGASTISQVHVEYGNAARLLRAELLQNVVESQFGPKGTRIMSLLRMMGKLEEKHIAKITIMPMGETRDVCARLFASSLISLQEVPKSSERIATRTIFFWYVDERKCTAWLCDHLFKTISRLSQRRRHELAKEGELVAKSQRKDYLEAPSLLNEVEKRRLRRVQETISIISLGERRAWQDLFVVLSLPE
jgi:DNA-directed RNA polymerase III subunit RPC3